MRRFFKCLVPRTKRYLSNGAPILFTDIGNNTGLYSTEDDAQANELALFEKRGEQGIFEITAEEYQSKKNNRLTSLGNWREEFGKKGPERNHQPQLLPQGQQPPNISVQGAVAAIEQQEAPAPVAESVGRPMTPGPMPRPKASPRQPKV